MPICGAIESIVRILDLQIVRKMKTILIFSLLLLISMHVHAIELFTQSPYSVQSDYSDQLAQQGCCSHHGGVCGCESGRAVCCDGQFSPSCGCHANDVKEFLKENDLEKPKS